ncbi:mannose-6-phosphate isomerase, class I [Diaminobutyricibacter tongyongensis]|uniref:mannose-6-phosphate isomerase n=1 Tax=Leifsonia tongyongensis TaxID=1268043 RepID=A0A6L9Y063_9MICO|nr:mannose-6-phosphate isomerase, class I [Diaminobutyricibacter tongyongensis]NEN07031.1 mannose-6-phosphate isomerase, class I [Diaminobutyricibacter tongyongensis]
MFVRIGNTPRDYDWGSRTAIAELLGSVPSGAPEAELWLGAHPGSPSAILDSAETDGARDLATWIDREPRLALGETAAAGEKPHLPYLMKVLAADRPLSLQAHPSSGQAGEGFARENARGLPLDSPERNYKDAFHKPELIYALSETFDALSGYRDPAVSARVLDALAEGSDPEGLRLVGLLTGRLRHAPAGEALRDSTAWLLGADPDVRSLVEVVTGAAARRGTAGDPEVASAADTVAMLAQAFPGDPGIVLALLLNRIALRRGEVLYLPAGNIHAYLHGLGIELMAASDNVLRGGLTSKRVDVPELLAVLDFSPFTAKPLEPESPAPGLETYRPDVPDFALDVVQLDGAVSSVTVRLPGAATAVCTEGSLEFRGASHAVRLSRGEAMFVTPDERELVISGSGTVFIAVPNR